MPENKKILIAEDDSFLVEAYKVKFNKSGYEAQIVTDGEELLKTVSSFLPDLILLDLIMPVKDGITTLAELKQGSYKDIPVIIASNLGQSEDVKKGLEMGAVDYIVKSDTSLNELMDKVAKYVSK